MLVSDLINQYQNSLSSGSKIATKTKGVEQLSNTVNSLEKGQIFEGTVSSVKGDKVTLALSSGQSVTARLDRGISLTEGQSVFFQVKSNEGGVIQIRPVNTELGGNPTLINALKNAGLPESEANLLLINAMMKEQMPVDKDSVRAMLGEMRAYPNSNIDTLVSLKKLGLPINEGMITQFNNYKESKGAILQMVDNLSSDITIGLSGKNITKEGVIKFQEELLNIINKNNANPEDTVKITEKTKSSLLNNDMEIIDTLNSPKSEILKNINIENMSVNPENTGKEDVSKGQIINLAEPKEMGELNRLFINMPEFVRENPSLFNENGLNPNIGAKQLFFALNEFFLNNTNISKQDILSFMSLDPIKNLMKQFLGNAWTIEPKELLRKDAIGELYEEIEKDMNRIMELAKRSTGAENNPISNSASAIRDNLGFIREVNQIYQYVQIPLKMSGENTTGELYVYTNKRTKKDKDDEITAFLHFDMENLGSTDIAVKLKGNILDTKFFLEDDLSYNLVAKNLHILEERLTELGYSCTMSVENESNSINFVEDFLMRDVNKSQGPIQRYSFDVRA